MSRYCALATVMSLALVPACIEVAIPGLEGLDSATIATGLDLLQSGELDSLQAALDGVDMLSSATSATQGAAGGPTTGSFGAAQTLDQCPNVTGSLDLEEGLSIDIGVDFGDGCTPNEGDVACSGSMEGSFNQAEGTFALTFNDLVCDDRDLNGSVVLSFDNDDQTVGLFGDWNLSRDVEGQNQSVAGTASVMHDRDPVFTRVESFIGTVSEGEASYSLTLTDTTTSYPTYANFIPYTGQALITGDGIRDITVTFDADSPVTGEVLIQVGSTPAFTADLDDLDDLE